MDGWRGPAAADGRRDTGLGGDRVMWMGQWGLMGSPLFSYTCGGDRANGNRILPKPPAVFVPPILEQREKVSGGYPSCFPLPAGL